MRKPSSLVGVVLGASIAACSGQDRVANVGFVAQSDFRQWIEASSKNYGHPSESVTQHASDDLTIPPTDKVVQIVYSANSLDYNSINPEKRRVVKIALCKDSCGDGKILYEDNLSVNSMTGNFALIPPVSGTYTLEVHLSDGTKKTDTANLIVRK